MMNTYDFRVSVGSSLEGESHTRTYRIVARTREDARKQLWGVVMTHTRQFECASLVWERHRGPYTVPRGLHDVEVRSALRPHGASSYRRTAFVYDCDGRRVTVRSTVDRNAPDQVLTWDEFRAAWSVIPGVYS